MMHGTADTRIFQNPRSNYGLVLFRWGSLALLVAAAVTGREALAWPSLPILGIVLILSWGLRVAFVENLRNLHRLAPEAKDGDDRDDLPAVTIISPARDEASCIEAAVRGLEALDYPELEIIVVEDHSSDGTSEILARLAKEMPRVRILKDPPLQEGWLGKTNSAWYGAQLADPSHEWLLFMDVGVVFHHKVVRRAVSYAEANGLDFLTCIPFITNVSLVEELVLPVPLANVVMRADPDKLNQPCDRAIGGGAFMLMRRDVYWATGGHSACHNCPDEGLMAEVVKRQGGNVGAVWTAEMVRVRNYHGCRDLRARFPHRHRMVAGDRLSYQIGQVGLTLLLCIAPLPLALAAVLHQVARPGFSPAFTVYFFLAFLVYLNEAMVFRRCRAICQIRPGVPWLHPLGGIMRVWFGLLAIVGTLRKTKITWRGRSVPGT